MTNAMVLRPQTFDQLMTFANMAAKSALVPRDYQGKPENIMLAIQMGSEIGLAPMQSLQNIAVINGRPAVWGDALLALCKAHPAWGSITEEVTGDGDKMQAVCSVARKGDNLVTVTFSVDDAKAAKLWNKRGANGQDTPWITYPKRMLQMRARGFALRDAFPDALKGLISAEEASDLPPDDKKPTTFQGPIIEAKAEPPSAVGDERDKINAEIPFLDDPPPAPKPAKKAKTWADLVAEIRAKADACRDQDEAAALGDDATVKKAMQFLTPDSPVRQEIEAILGETYQRFVEAVEGV